MHILLFSKLRMALLLFVSFFSVIALLQYYYVRKQTAEKEGRFPYFASLSKSNWEPLKGQLSVRFRQLVCDVLLPNQDRQAELYAVWDAHLNHRRLLFLLSGQVHGLQQKERGCF